ncbi:uncharacterized protein N7484_009718 [Penicillium longicatenatum]|uniref:uncharacterized protein n=1 Tax=Penicillium longicatenatum TaxID=1561947 RepID=UPI002546D33F|nr:uncharacterized protein N7484_009718 [Penicillium longicatenatum]KAJ5636405.1 hypothetical protein N7484_009718 [Penicillium longicatenatum]KAJ5656610.1 hypothetical protein N7507_008560 [Penicillium longicatenatum]
MSFLTSLRMSSGRLVQSSYAIPATSAFHTTAMQRGLKENDHNRDDDLAQHYESEKHAQMKKAKDGTGKWTEGLASNSEAGVKADRGDLDTESKDFQQMQEQIKKGKAAGKSQ